LRLQRSSAVPDAMSAASPGEQPQQQPFGQGFPYRELAEDEVPREGTVVHEINGKRYACTSNDATEAPALETSGDGSEAASPPPDDAAPVEPDVATSGQLNGAAGNECETASQTGDGAGFTTTNTPQETDDEVIARLAKLTLLEFDRVREAEANRLGIRLLTLEREVAAARGGNGADTRGPGRAIDLPAPKQWPHPVNGAALLNGLATYFARHLVLPPGAADGCALWTVHTFCFDAFRITPRLQFKSAVKGSGKSTAIELVRDVVPKPVEVETATAAFLFRVVEICRPTLLMDEAQDYLLENRELQAMLKAGYKAGGQAGRCVGENNEPRQFSCHAPVVLANMRNLPDQIEDRAIKIVMQKRLASESLRPIDDVTRALAARLRSKAARWAADHYDELRRARPDMERLFNRQADLWRSLYAIADRAGGDWPARARKTMRVLSAAAGDDDRSGDEQLLADIKSVFDGTDLDAPKPVDAISSGLLCKRLAAIQTSPWGEYGKARKPITQRQLARVLLRFRITPGTVRLPSGKTPKGYHRDAFRDPWTRYLDDDHAASAGPGGSDPPQRHPPTDPDLFGMSDPPQQSGDVAAGDGRSPASEAGCGGVADRDTPAPGIGGDDADEVVI
jgi:putative DNA primase/helicase